MVRPVRDLIGLKFRGSPGEIFYYNQSLIKTHTYLALSANCLSFGQTNRLFDSPAP